MHVIDLSHSCIQCARLSHSRAVQVTVPSRGVAGNGVWDVGSVDFGSAASLCFPAISGVSVGRQKNSGH